MSLPPNWVAVADEEGDVSALNVLFLFFVPFFVCGRSAVVQYIELTTMVAAALQEYFWNKVTNETTWERPAPPPPPNKPVKPPKPEKPPRPASEMPRTEAKVAVSAPRPYSEMPRYTADSKTPETTQKLSTSPITSSERIIMHVAYICVVS